MKVNLRFGRTRHAVLDGPPTQVLIALAMVLAFALALGMAVTGAVTQVGHSKSKAAILKSVWE